MGIVAVGETMVMLKPEPPGLPHCGTSYRPAVAGAESNVACFAAQLGVRSAWVSRLGDDGFGTMILDELVGYGVDVECVERDADRPTAVAFKDISTAATVTYFRRDSAASAMDGATTAAAVRSLAPRIVHLTGITAALSPSCAALASELVERRSRPGIVSLDVNWRPALWRHTDPAALLPLARAADVEFVGEDEAAAAWGVDGTDATRDLLPDVATLVVKHGERGATAFAGEGQCFVPSLSVSVVDPIGAGDALAAGFLTGLTRDLPLLQCLRLGTVVAACALRAPSDVGPVPSAAELDRLLGADDDTWAGARIESLDARET